MTPGLRLGIKMWRIQWEQKIGYLVGILIVRTQAWGEVGVIKLRANAWMVRGGQGLACAQSQPGLNWIIMGWYFITVAAFFCMPSFFLYSYVRSMPIKIHFEQCMRMEVTHCLRGQKIVIEKKRILYSFASPCSYYRNGPFKRSDLPVKRTIWRTLLYSKKSKYL